MEILPQKTPKKFYCQKCDFLSSNKKDWKRHISTAKHRRLTLANPRLTRKNPTRRFECGCGKRYKHSSSLSKHRKKCSTRHVGHILGEKAENTYIVKEEPEITTEMFNKLVDQNNTLMEKLVELSKEKQVINYQNCNNKKMTINVFLNERCKDAMNLTDFMENVKVSLADLMYTKDHGYVKGISNIFVRHLSNLDPMERPIHCSDRKRLQFYVKDKNTWGKDTDNHKNDKSIEDITIKQIKNIKEWEKRHPNYMEDQGLMQEWHTMIHKITGGSEDDERDRNKEQIKKSIGNTIEIKDAMVVEDGQT